MSSATKVPRKKEIIDSLQSMPIYLHREAFVCLRSRGVRFTENKNGVFFNLSNAGPEVWEDLQKLLQKEALVQKETREREHCMRQLQQSLSNYEDVRSPHDGDAANVGPELDVTDSMVAATEPYPPPPEITSEPAFIHAGGESPDKKHEEGEEESESASEKVEDESSMEAENQAGTVPVPPPLVTNDPPLKASKKKRPAADPANDEVKSTPSAPKSTTRDILSMLRSNRKS